MSIICTGSIAYDYLMTFPGYFRDHILLEKVDTISLSFLVDKMVRQRGGTAPNIAYTLALLGEKPKLMATAGLDFDDYRIWLDENGVDTSLVNVIPDKYTASFFANTDLSNSQIASFYTGAMANASELSILDIPKKPDLVIISPNDPLAMEKYVEECLEEQIPYVYDPSQQIVRMDPKVLTRGVLGAYSVFVNAYELELLQKHTGLSCDEIVKKINFLVVTRGDCGASVFADGIEHPIDCVKPEKIVDPTGVGDAFRGGFIRGWRLGLEWTTCGQMGSLAATYCLEQSGTQNHHFSIREFIQRYRQNFNDQDALDILINRN